MAAPSQKVLKPVGPWLKVLQKWAYNKSYFPSLGLMRDDCLYENPEVKEAIKRLPKEVYNQRNFRLARAARLSGAKTILPKEEWMTLENDVKYLQPYIEQITKEWQERKEWNTKY